MSTIVGQTLLRQFRVDAFVASGGMGAVYRVWDLKRNVPLAMKVLHSELAEDPSIFKRFQREANALKKLAHPNIVPFYGMFHTLDFTFLLERFIDGPSLKDVLRQRQGKPLPIEETLVYLKALCAALGYAHANGVVHCDVKPGNVMMDRGGNVYLTDFGIARHAESTTTTMGTAGTPAYMAPEQIRGEPVSPATDIYALGVVLYEMLTGQRPFRGTEAGTERGGATTNERIRYGHLNLQPPDPVSINPALPVGLGGAILKALAKRPQDRYASTMDLFNAICRQAVVTAGVVADQVTLPGDFVQEDEWKQSVAIPVNQAVAQGVPTSKRHSLWLVIGGVVICMLVIGGIVLISGQPRSQPGIVSNPQLPVTVTQASVAIQQFVATSTSILIANPSPSVTFEVSATFRPTSIANSENRSPLDGMVMENVPAGYFEMGLSRADQDVLYSNCPNCDPTDFHDAPQRHIYLDEYWIDKTEVTVAQFAKFVDSTGYITTAEKQGWSLSFVPSANNFIPTYGHDWLHPQGVLIAVNKYGQYPVVHVSWNDANTYCAWVGRRLPTEAEWEKAARGTDGRIFPWGNSLPTIKMANINPPGNTQPAGSYPAGASPYHVLDMTGNVWEWTSSYYQEYYYTTMSEINPPGPSSGENRVLRGGSWGTFINIELDLLSSAFRLSNPPGYSSDLLGFRCATSSMQ